MPSPPLNPPHFPLGARRPAESRPRVLVIDASDDAREILRAVCDCRGWTFLEAREPAAGRELARRHRPEAVVVDLETATPEDLADPDADATDDAPSGAAESPPSERLVLLGELARGKPPLPSGRVLAKPYHYSPLVRTIQEVIDSAAGSRVAAP